MEYENIWVVEILILTYILNVNDEPNDTYLIYRTKNGITLYRRNEMENENSFTEGKI